MIKLNKTNPLSILFVGLSIVFVIYYIIGAKKSISDIDSHMAETIGYVIDYKTGGNTVSYITYSYKVNGKAYKNSTSKRAFKGCEHSQWCIGVKLTVEYSSVNPENSRIDWGAGYEAP